MLLKIDFNVCCLKELHAQVILYFEYFSLLLCLASVIHFGYFWFGFISYGLYKHCCKRFTLHFRIILELMTWHPGCAHWNTIHARVHTHAHVHTRVCTHTHACTHVYTHAHMHQSLLLPCSVCLWPLLEASEVSLLILHLPPVKCFFRSQNCSSRYFMKQLDRSLRVVLACPNASKMLMTCRKRETVTALFMCLNKMG